MPQNTQILINNIAATVVRNMYITMVKIRKFEEKVIELYPVQDMRTPVHLCIGQEAIAAGVCAILKKDDYIFSTHRGHGHYIAKGGDLTALVAELYGRRAGCAKGKGGSMHLVDPEIGIPGFTAIVGGCIPVSVGAALAFSLRGETRVSVVFFGDGAVDTGAFHEGLNFASLKKLPVIFICENNFYATNSPQLARQPSDNIYKRAEGYEIPGVRIDGNDVIAVYEASREAVNRARSRAGPTLIECRTYRWKQHVGPDTDFELGCRPKQELDEWMEKCPIRRYRELLLSKNIMSESEMNEVAAEIDREIEDAVTTGKNSPLPDERELLDDLY